MINPSASQAPRAFVVVNPMAGSADPDALRHALTRHLAQGGISYELYQVTGEERLKEVIHTALDRGFDTVIASGGDGTVSGVADGLVHTSIPLGIIPVGTVNTLARDLGIPLDLDEALKVLAGKHAVRTIDVIQAQERYFLLNISIGVSSLIMRQTQAQLKRRFGLIAYIWKGAKWLMGFQLRRFNLTVDGQSTRLRATEVVVANSNAIVMPSFTWGSHVSIDDGQLDVCILRAQTGLDYLRLTWSILLGRQRRDPNVNCLSAGRSFVIDADQPLPVQGDGEMIGQTPVEVKVVPGALRVIVPDGVESVRR